LDINKKGTSILLVEQNARLALRLAHRGYVLETGNLALEGKCEDLLTDTRVKKSISGTVIKTFRFPTIMRSLWIFNKHLKSLR